MSQGKSDLKVSYVVSAAIISSVMAVYLWLSSTTPLGGDQGIFALVGMEGGYAQAPGYPIYSWFLHFFSFVDPSPIAASSYLTALLSVSALAVMFGALRAWNVGLEAAWLAVLAFGFVPNVVYFGTQAEVFALNHVFVAAILWACAPKYAESKPMMRCLILGGLAGLALSHHQTSVFLAPLGLWAVFQSCRTHQKWTALGAALLGLTLGLTPYLYLSWVEYVRPSSWHWGDPSSLSGLIDLFLRRDFGTFQMTVIDADEETSSGLFQVGFLLSEVAKDFVWIGLIGALFGLWRMKKAHRMESFMVAGSLLLAGPLFVSMLHRVPEGLDFLLVRKFHLLFELLVAFSLAFALDSLIRRKELAWVLIGLVMFLGVWRSTDYVLGMETNAVSDFVADTWSVVPENGVVIGTGDHLSMGSEMLLRSAPSPRGYFVSPTLLAHRWYRDRVNRDLGIESEHKGVKVDLVAFVMEIHRVGRPVWVDSSMAPNLKGVRMEPDGLLIRVLDSSATPRTPMDVAQALDVTYAKFRFRPDEVTQNPWKATCAQSYAQNWTVLASVFQRSGQLEQAKLAEQRAGFYKQAPIAPR